VAAIASEIQHLAVAQQVEARVTGVRPVGDAVLHDAGDAGGARRVGQAVAEREVEDGAVRIEHALVQKMERVGKVRAGLPLEVVGQRLHGDLRGDLAVVMAAHAVGDDHEQGVARIAVADAILVVATPPLAAVLVDGELHRYWAFANFPTMRPIQPVPFCSGSSTASTSAFCSAKTLCGR
jgi:hypothetical protein